MSTTPPPPSAWAKFLAGFKNFENWTAGHHLIVVAGGSFAVGVVVGFLLFH